MVGKLTTRIAIAGLVGFGLASSMGSGCSVVPGTLTEDACGFSKRVCLTKTLHAGTTNGQSDYFELETPEARNDCHAEYIFEFRWADPVRRISDTDMPPLQDLAHAFQPGGEFAYFPHDPPTLIHGIFTPGCTDTATESQSDFWSIHFSSGNQNSSRPTTRYYVGVGLDPALASSLDDTEIHCSIIYYDKPTG